MTLAAAAAALRARLAGDPRVESVGPGQGDDRRPAVVVLCRTKAEARAVARELPRAGQWPVSAWSLRERAWTWAGWQAYCGGRK